MPPKSTSPSLQSFAINHAVSVASTAIAFTVLASTTTAYVESSSRILLSFSANTVSLTISSSNSDKALFRPNPLTNPILEQIRIWKQAKANSLKYGGELEAGSVGKGANAAAAYTRLLVPILRIQQDLQSVQELLQSAQLSTSTSPGNSNNIQQAQHLPQKRTRIVFPQVSN